MANYKDCKWCGRSYEGSEKHAKYYKEAGLYYGWVCSNKCVSEINAAGRDHIERNKRESSSSSSSSSKGGTWGCIIVIILVVIWVLSNN